MRISLDVAFDEGMAVRLLNFLGAENVRILRQNPKLPLLYKSGVRYQRERGEIWSDYLNLLARGYEDCDALAAARMGELIAKGWRAVGPNDPGYAIAHARKPKTIRARVFLRTRTPKGVPGLFHCLVRYWIDDGRRLRAFEDDPSARLGMLDVPSPIAGRRNRRVA